MKTIAIAGTFDSKGHEYAYVKDLIESLGLNTLTINTGVFEPVFEADVSNEEVAKAAGPHRLEAAGKMGIPQVVSVGAVDMVNFGPMDSVPEKFKERNLYKHNPMITLMPVSYTHLTLPTILRV